MLLLSAHDARMAWAWYGEAGWRGSETWEVRSEQGLEGFPVCHIDDMIASKAAANRRKDRESLPRLPSSREYRIRRLDGASGVG
jgi:hypothetical protein